MVQLTDAEAGFAWGMKKASLFFLKKLSSRQAADLLTAWRSEKLRLRTGSGTAAPTVSHAAIESVWKIETHVEVGKDMGKKKKKDGRGHSNPKAISQETINRFATTANKLERVPLLAGACLVELCTTSSKLELTDLVEL